MGLLASVAWVSVAFAAAHVLESAWHRFIAHGKRPDPSRTGHLEHHRIAAEPVEVWREMRENAGRVALSLVVVSLALAPLIGAGASLSVTAGLAAGFVSVNLYHARMHRRAPRSRYEQWMWRFHWHHHAVDARVNFGLTNPLLDFVLGTAIVPDEVEVPAKLTPAWLHDAGGAVGGIRARAR